MERICTICLTNKRESHGIRNGKRRFKNKCWSCENTPYTRHKKNKCEWCGFVAVHRVQLDVDHIDGNHHNDDLSNLQTLCANCHRLKTHQDRVKKTETPQPN